MVALVREGMRQFLSEALPVISIDTKKKELIGNYRREGKAYRARWQYRS